MSHIDRKLKPISRGLLKRVRIAKAEVDHDPEFALYVRESKLRAAESFLYEVFPEGVARFLGRVAPNNKSVARVLEVWDYRTEHGFPPGYIPAGYQLPRRDQS